MTPSDSDEFIVLVARKHRLFLVLSFVLPTLLLVAAALGAAYLALGAFVGVRPIEGWAQLALYAAAAGVVVAVVWLVLAYREWQNDSLTLTDRRIIVKRQVFRLFAEEQEAPLYRIQNVTVTVPGPIAALFGYGDIAVATASAQSRLEFRAAPRPNAIKETIFRLQQMAQEQERGQRRNDIRRSLEQERR